MPSLHKGHVGHNPGPPTVRSSKKYHIHLYVVTYWPNITYQLNIFDSQA
jgi:hypothetical protein